MVDFKIGIHSRPAALIVKKVREYPNNRIVFTHNGKSCVGNSLIGLLSLGVGEGAKISIQVEGENKEIVLTEIIDFFTNSVAVEE